MLLDIIVQTGKQIRRVVLAGCVMVIAVLSGCDLLPFEPLEDLLFGDDDKTERTEPEDRTPPGVVSNLTAIRSPGKITVRWVNPGDDDFRSVELLLETVGVQPYRYAHYGNPAASIEKDISGVDDDLSYVITIVARDSNENRSPSVSITVAALPPPTQPPAPPTQPPAEKPDTGGGEQPSVPPTQPPAPPTQPPAEKPDTGGGEQPSVPPTQPPAPPTQPPAPPTKPPAEKPDTGGGEQPSVPPTQPPAPPTQPTETDEENEIISPPDRPPAEKPDTGGGEQPSVLPPPVQPRPPAPVPPAQQPVAVTNAQASARGAHGFALAWHNPQGSAFEGTSIVWTPADGDQQQPFVVRGSASGTSSARITGLTAGTGYSVGLTPIFRDGTPVAATTILVSTLPPQSDVSGLTLSFGDQWVTLNWQNPINSDFNHVEITWRQGRRAPSSITVPGAPGASMSHTINGLINLLPGIFTIKAYTTDGDSSSGIVREVTPLDATPPGAPRNLRARIEDSRLTIRWDYPADMDVDRFVVAWTPLHGIPSPTLPVLVPSPGNSLEIRNLINGQPYRFRVITFDDDGLRSPFVSLQVTPEDECVGTDATRCSLQIGTPQISSLSRLDTDWYRSDLEAGTEYFFYLSDLTNPYVRLVIDLYRDGSYDRPIASTISETRIALDTVMLRHTPDSSGSYFLVVRTIDASTVDQYALSKQFDDCGDDTSGACSIDVGDLIRGHIEHADDVDWFRTPAPISPGNYQIARTGAVAIFLYDENGNEIAQGVEEEQIVTDDGDRFKVRHVSLGDSPAQHYFFKVVYDERLPIRSSKGYALTFIATPETFRVNE